MRSIVQWVYPFPHAKSMHQTPQMHSNTCPTCFEGPRGMKIRFRDPGIGSRVKRGRTKLSTSWRAHFRKTDPKQNHSPRFRLVPRSRKYGVLVVFQMNSRFRISKRTPTYLLHRLQMSRNLSLRIRTLKVSKIEPLQAIVILGIEPSNIKP